MCSVRALLPKLDRSPGIYISEVIKEMKRILPIALLGMALAGTPLFGDQGAQPAQPGTVNYVEGSTFLNGKQLNPQDVGNIDMNAGEVLTTNTGRAEILLTPGVFLRVGQNSAVKMVSPEIVPTEVEVERGHAALEVDELHKQNDLEVATDGITTHIAKSGYYEFNADQPSVKVFKGEAVVDKGDGKYQTVKGRHEVAFEDGQVENPAKFDPNDSQDALYKWSSLRSQYLAEANQQIAGQYAGLAGYYPGWYWDPYIYGYTFLGADPFFSPFGWGFYPLGWGGIYGGYWGGGYYPHRWYHGPVGRYGNHGFRDGAVNHGEGFHGGSSGFHGGSQGGGGFHAGAGMHGGGRR